MIKRICVVDLLLLTVVTLIFGVQANLSELGDQGEVIVFLVEVYRFGFWGLTDQLCGTLNLLFILFGLFIDITLHFLVAFIIILDHVIGTFTSFGVAEFLKN